MDLAWLSLLALLLVVAVSCLGRANPGVVAIALAWAIAVYAAPWFGQSLGIQALVAGFPTDLFLTLLGVSLLFTQAEVNGTLARVAQVAQQLCRGNLGLMSVTFFVLALTLGTVGPGNIAVAGLIAPVAMAAAYRTGIPPFLMAIMVGHGAIASMLSPLTAAGVVADKILEGLGLGGHEWQIYADNALANAAVALGGFLLFGGRKLFAKWHAQAPPGGDQAATGQLDGPSLRFAVRHWVTLAVIAALIAGVVAGKAHIGMAALAGAALLSLLRMADERETFQKLPWSVILMVCGVSVLTSLLDKTGGTRRFAELITAGSTPQTETGALAFVTGLVSVYSSTTGVVLPAFLPMVKELVEVRQGSDPLALAQSVIVGGSLVDMSPLSTIGALCAAGAPAGVDRRVLFNQLLAWGFAMSVAGGILCWVCFRPA